MRYLESGLVERLRERLGTGVVERVRIALDAPRSRRE
jgi:hypothetical protein